MPNNLLYLFLAIAVAMGAWTAFLFEKKGRKRPVGFWLGFLFGIIGVIIAYTLSSKKNQES